VIPSVVNDARVREAQRAAERGELLDFAVAHLREGAPAHEDFAASLLQRRPPVRLRLVDLARVQRVAGPESGMRWRSDPERFRERISAIRAAIESGYPPAPLIVVSRCDELLVSDGSHTLEALRELGATRWWVIEEL
jgi:hypothetical protein